MSLSTYLLYLAAVALLVLSPGAFFLIGAFIWCVKTWKKDLAE